MATAVGIWAVLVGAFALVAGLLLVEVEGEVPAYAMDSVLLFRLERSLAIAAILILPVLVIAPLLAGSLPRKVSSDGIDWGEERGTVVETLDAFNKRLEELESALREMTELNDG